MKTLHLKEPGCGPIGVDRNPTSLSLSLSSWVEAFANGPNPIRLGAIIAQ